MAKKAKGIRLSTVLTNYGGSFTMPGGFKVNVEILGKDDAHVEMGSQVLAQYYQDEHRILLKRSRSTKNRRTDLEHEIQHACVDWIDHFMRKARVSKPSASRKNH